jgi:radical SAM superfamily enzyme YgiQ (UPF0313 family)
LARIYFIKPNNLLPYNFVTQPLGIMYLTSVLRRHGHEVGFLDLRIHRMPPADAAEKALAFEPDIVGFSTLTLEYSVVAQVAKEIKARKPGVLTIVGGPHASTDPEAILANPDIDYLCFGEAEDTMPEFVDAALNGGDASQVKGIGFRENGSMVKTEERPLIQELDDIPMPAWDIIEMEPYFDVPNFNIVVAHRRTMPIFTTRGCPYRCTYCHNIFGKRARQRSPENVLEEMKILHDKYGIREFQVIDDVFNINNERAIEICDLILQSGMKIFLSFPNAIRGDIVTPELVAKMKEAGAYKVNYAIETASPRLQKMVKKRVKLDKLKEAIRITNEAGIWTHGFFMMGFPTETREEVQMTVDYACTSKLNTAGFFVLQPFPGTEIWDQIKGMGIDIPFDSDLVNYFQASYKISEVEPEELFKIVKNANRRFYLNPLRGFNTLMRMPKKGQIFTFVGLFLQRALGLAKVDKD